MSYKLLSYSSGVLRVEDSVFIPADSANVDWQRYQAFLTGGGVPQPADPILAPASPFAVKEQRTRALETLAASDSNVAKIVDVLKIANLI